jgi:hypothetical protein
MSKNPFELRFDVLEMAKTMLDAQYELACNNYWNMLEDAKKQSKDMTDLYSKYTPKMYQPEEIMETAEKLYKFVSKKD